MFKLLETARRRTQNRPRYVAPGTDCSPGSYVDNVVQIQSPIEVVNAVLIRDLFSLVSTDTQVLDKLPSDSGCIVTESQKRL